MEEQIVVLKKKIKCNINILGEPFDLHKIEITKKFIKKYYGFDFDKRKIEVLDRKNSLQISLCINGSDEVFYLGIASLKQLYKLIVKKKPLNLNLTYVEGFNADSILFKENENIANIREICGIQACYSFWNGRTQFNGINFKETIDFFGAQFWGDVNFSKSIFNGDVIFRYTQIFTKVYFTFCTFRKNSIFDGIGYNFFDFRDIVVEQYLFWNDFKVLDDSLNKVDIIDFSNSVIVGKFEVYWSKSMFKAIISNKDINKIANMFIILKQAYNDLGLFEEEDKAYYWYRAYSNKLLKNKPLKIFDSILCWLGGYGTKPLRVIINMVITIVIFAIVMVFLNVKEISTKLIMEYLYLSMQAYAALMFRKSIFEAPFLNILCLFEGILGSFQLLYFTICFSRKAIR